MKQTKFVLIAAGVLGLLAVFALPYFSLGGQSIKYWDFHNAPESATRGILNGPKQVYIAIVCFLAVAAMGGLAMAGKKLLRWQAIVAIVFGALLFALEGVRKGLSGEGGMSTAIGGKVLFLAALVGLIGGILGVAKAEQ